MCRLEQVILTLNREHCRVHVSLNGKRMLRAGILILSIVQQSDYQCKQLQLSYKLNTAVSQYVEGWFFSNSLCSPTDTLIL